MIGCGDYPMVFVARRKLVCFVSAICNFQSARSAPDQPSSSMSFLIVPIARMCPAFVTSPGMLSACSLSGLLYVYSPLITTTLQQILIGLSHVSSCMDLYVFLIKNELVGVQLR